MKRSFQPSMRLRLSPLFPGSASRIAPVLCGTNTAQSQKRRNCSRTNMAEQTRQVLDNLCAVVRAAGMRKENMVRTTVFLADMADYGVMNEIYAIYFAEAPPARTTVQVSALPRGARIEIEAVADSPAREDAWNYWRHRAGVDHRLL